MGSQRAAYLYGRSLSLYADGIPPWLPQVTSHLEKCMYVACACVAQWPLIDT